MESPTHNKRDIPCPHCKRLFKTTSGVAQHIEATQLDKVNKTVAEWDITNQITDPVYTHRIQEVDSEDDDYVLVGRRDKGPSQVINVLANEDTWNSDVQAYVCPTANCEREFQKLRDLNQHLHSQVHVVDHNTFHCPKCKCHYAVISALIQHLEGGSCGLAEQSRVKEIYTGLHDMFKMLLKP